MKFCYLSRLLRIWDDPKYLGGWRFILLSDQISKPERLDRLSQNSVYVQQQCRECGRHIHIFRAYYLPHSSYIFTPMKSVLVNTISF